MTLVKKGVIQQYLRCDYTNCGKRSVPIYDFSCYTDDELDYEWRDNGWIYKDGKHFCAECAEKQKCPFCGEVDWKICTSWYAWGKCEYVVCLECAARGPESIDGMKKPDDLWNTRQ